MNWKEIRALKNPRVEPCAPMPRHMWAVWLDEGRAHQLIGYVVQSGFVFHGFSGITGNINATENAHYPGFDGEDGVPYRHIAAKVVLALHLIRNGR